MRTHSCVLHSCVPHLQPKKTKIHRTERNGHHYEQSKRQKTVGNRYFGGGKNFGLILVAAIALIVIGLVSWYYLYGILWLMSPLPILVGIIMLISLFTGRISDQGYHEYMENQLVTLWSNQKETEGALPDHTVIEYEGVGEGVTRSKKGSDNKLRTDVLCRTELFFEPGALRVKQGKAYADGEGSELHCVTLPISRVTASIEMRKNPQLASFEKNYMLLSVDGSEAVVFPIPSNDYDMEALVEKINHARDRATDVRFAGGEK